MLNLRKILFFLFFSCSNSIHFPVHQKDPFHNLHGINTRRYFCYDWYGNGRNHMNCECFIIRCCTDPVCVMGQCGGNPIFKKHIALAQFLKKPYWFLWPVRYCCSFAFYNTFLQFCYF